MPAKLFCANFLPAKSSIAGAGREITAVPARAAAEAVRGIRLLPLMLPLIALLFAAAALPSAVCAANSQYRMVKDGSVPTGKNYVALKAGTLVVVNEKGHVLEGTLSKSQFVSFARGSARFKEGTKIVLNDSGHLLYGTLLANETIFNGRNFFRYKAVTEVFFDKDGNLRQGTLLGDQVVGTNAQRCFFRGGYPVEFKHAGFIARGTLAADQELTNGHFSLFYKKETEAFFDSDGNITSGVLLYPERLYTAGGAAKVFPAGTRVIYDRRGFVKN